MKVLDSTADLDLGALFRAVMAGQVAGAMQYVAPAGWKWPKAITPARYAQLTVWHIPIALNFESSGKSWSGGRAAGMSDGTNARLGAREVGHPDARPILFSADEPVTDLAVCGDYIGGVNAVNGGRLQGFYGDAEAIDYLFAHGLISVGWQTNARGWPGDGVDDPRAALIQRTTHSVAAFPSNLYDESDVQHADWGQFPAPFATPPTPKPIPTPVPGKVAPMYSPPLAAPNGIAAVWAVDAVVGNAHVSAVLAAVAPDGEVYAWGVPYRVWANRATDFAGRTAAKIGPAPGLPFGRYMITATSGETYTP